MGEALTFLQSVAQDYCAAIQASPGGARCEITIPRPSGREHVFQLDLTIRDSEVEVREALGLGSLPALCPDRHINSDGSFCLGWGPDKPGNITDEHSARRWWVAVSRFLSGQVGANRRRVFPGSEHDRAHGDAAEHQAKAEEAAARLGPIFAMNAKNGRLVVRSDQRPKRPRLELMLDGVRIARASERRRSLVGGHIPCPCDDNAGREISSCGTHASDLATFIVAIHQCGVADQAYSDTLAKAGFTCCGTLDSCGLRDAQNRHQNKSKPSGNSNGRRSKFWRPPARSKRYR